ncbi:hypothetical protein GWO43_16175 [candidate division KSB1 bacterium]|nr:hypothetical protein [candidate division KSB1 bacterium]NIV68771.1 hypothetical protein [Phycisphaerae bacterium]NIS25488.1 hypothetical protein [candidate division KSB1 bacterium]NIT72381.1 hypothetical protein [candidate division KSB1 bacterium]NIU26165.1 hypothetical protein [candidate division KSB1 bacterium]
MSKPIDMTGLAIPKQGGVKRNRAYKTRLVAFHIERVVGMGCLVCGRPAQYHHSLLYKPRREDRGYPLCSAHHTDTRDSVHQMGERKFLAEYFIPLTWARDEWNKSQRLFEEK